MYYILLLLQMEIILPYIIRGLRNHRVHTFLWMITPLYLVYVYIWYFITDVHPPLYGTLVPAYFIFYLLGLEIQENKSIIRRYGQRGEILMIIGLFLSIVEAVMLDWLGMPMFAVSQLKLSSFIYSIALIIVLLKHEKTIEKTRGLGLILHQLGDDSYAVFFLHCLWLRVFGVVMKRVVFFITLPWLVQTLVYLVFTVAMCEVTIYTVRTLAMKTGFSKRLKYIGF